MGLRKVLGASTLGIAKEQSREFAYYLVVANLVSWPVAYLFAQRWLQDFAYRIDVGMEPIRLASVITAIAAMLALSYHTIKSAGTDPVEALRQ